MTFALASLTQFEINIIIMNKTFADSPEYILEQEPRERLRSRRILWNQFPAYNCEMLIDEPLDICIFLH